MDERATSDQSRALKITVGIATKGRAALLPETVAHLRKQERPADKIEICPFGPSDVGDAFVGVPDVEIVYGGRGSSPQRNTLLASNPDADIMLFLDDDFFPAPNYIREIEKVFLSEPDIAVATGDVIADGVKGPGLSIEDALGILSKADLVNLDRSIEPTYGGYGCNMACRLSLVREHGIEFDELLPQYAWLEDIDFSRQLARYGRIVKVNAAKGVHLGVKAGRQSGLRLGYSQIANPVYLMGKRTFSPRVAYPTMMRNCISNLVRSFAPEPYVDRWGRLRGNLMAFADLARGRLEPGRIDQMHD